jgi:hypothetical protein
MRLQCIPQSAPVLLQDPLKLLSVVRRDLPAGPAGTKNDHGGPWQGMSPEGTAGKGGWRAKRSPNDQEAFLPNAGEINTQPAMAAATSLRSYKSTLLPAAEEEAAVCHRDRDLWPYNWRRSSVSLEEDHAARDQEAGHDIAETNRRRHR